MGTSNTAILPEDEDEAERLLMERACAEAIAEDVWVPHELVREWLLKLANGDRDTKPPIPLDRS